MSVSASKRAANRLNAQKSTGPRTDQGKARSSRNAVTHGIYCSEWLVENEDGEELEALKDNLLGRMRPRDAVELAVVEEYLSCAWRLRRVRRAESLAYDNELFAIQASLAKQHREHPELTPPGAEGLIPSTEWVTLSLLESKTAAHRAAPVQHDAAMHQGTARVAARGD